MYPTDTVLEKTQKAFFVKVYCVFVVCQSYDVLNDGTSFILNIFFIPCHCSFLQRGFVSGSGDSTVKFWEFELVSDAQHSQVR